MKKALFLIIFVSISLGSFSQTYYKNSDSTKVRKNRFGLWTTPFKATHVYGILLNIWPSDINNPTPTIYGAELNLHPLGIIVPPGRALGYLIFPQFHFPSNKLDSSEFASFKKIYGLQLGIFTSEPRDIYGLNINASGSIDSNTHGLTLSPIVNKHYIIDGLTVGLIGNHDVKCNGVQLGLVNSCTDLKGFQIGLLNRNQARTLPFINWAFKSNETGSMIVNAPQTVELLIGSRNSEVIRYADKYKTRINYGLILGIIGIEFGGLWLFRSIMEKDFPTSTLEDRRWNQIVVGSAITLSATGLILGYSARKQLKLGIETYNKR